MPIPTAKLHLMTVLFCLLPVLLATPAASADNDDLAKKHFEKGAESYRLLDFESALISFETAYELRPSYKLLFNIAQTQLELGFKGLALQTFEQYLHDGGDKIDSRRREAVSTEIRRLRKDVGRLMVEGPLGMELRVDGEHRGFLPLAKSIWLNKGMHTINLYMNGEQAYTRAVEIKAGKTRIQRLYEDGEMMGPGPPRPEVEWLDIKRGATTYAQHDPGPEKNALQVVPIPFLAVGGTTLAIGLATGIRAARLNASLNNSCNQTVCQDSKADKIESMENSALATDVMLVTSTVLISTAVAMLVIGKKRNNK